MNPPRTAGVLREKCGMGEFKVNIYIETTVRGPRREAAAGMWLAEYIKKDHIPETRSGILCREDATQNALTLELMNAAFLILTKPCLVRVNTECAHVLNVMRNGFLPIWEKNGWINAKGAPVKNREAWSRAYSLMSAHAVTVEDGWHGYREVMRREIRKAMKT